MKQRLVWLAFALVCAIQLAAPASMIFGHERTLAQGRAFRFQTAPVDPYDPFRGKYVALNFGDNRTRLPKNYQGALSRAVYAPIEVGADGFARLGEAATTPPAGPYLTFDVSGGYPGQQLQMPFDRFYLDEGKAPQAEAEYLERARDRDAYLVVRVLDGNWAIEGLVVGGKSIRDIAAGR